MTNVNIEMTYEQVDAIVLQELKRSLESNLNDYHNKVNVCDKRKDHRKLIEGLHRTVAYFMEYHAFQGYADSLIWPKKIKRNKYDWI